MLATQIEVSDGTLHNVNIGILYFNQTDITVSLGQSDLPLVLGTDYVWTATNVIQFLPTAGVPGGLVPAGMEVVIRRDTKNDEMYNIYDGGAPFSRTTLDENYKQLLFLSQEFSEGLGLDGLRNNLDMNGYKVVNVGDPVQNGDAANKGYVDGLNKHVLRVPELIDVLPDAATRANHLLGFDATGQPIATLPEAGSATELALDLLNGVDPTLGASLLGYAGGTVRDALDSALTATDGEHSLLHRLGAPASVSRTLHDRLAQTVSVKDFGAVCDGVTNDQVAVQAAVDYCLSFDPPKILEVPGVSYLSGPVLIERHVDSANSQTYFIIQGVGDGGFMCDSTVMFTAYPASTSWMPESQKIRFQDLVFKQSHWSYDGFILEGRRFLAVDFNNCSFLKIRVADTETYLQTWYFNNCSAFNYYGWLLRSTGGAYDVHWNMCKVQASQSFNGINGGFLSLTNEWAIHSADPVTGCSVVNSHVQAMGGTAIECDRVQGVSIIGTYFELNGSVDILFATVGNQAGRSGASRGASVIGCTFGSTATNLLDPDWRPIQWGKMSGGFASGNAYPNGGGAKLHGLLPGGASKVFLNGEPGIDGLYVTEWITADGGYVQPGVGGERLKTLRGTVGSTGLKEQGDGFTSVRTALGTYTLTFSTPFASPPSFTANAADTTGDSVTVKYVTLTADSITVRLRAGGSAVDCAFSFNTTGPV